MPNNDNDQAKPVDATLVPADNRTRTVNLNFATSKRYIAELKSMGAKEAMEFVKDQVLTKYALINDQIIKQLEVLDGETDARRRLEAQSHIAALEAAAHKIAESKVLLDKALSLDLAAALPENSAPEPAKPVELGEAEFMATYRALLPK